MQNRPVKLSDHAIVLMLRALLGLSAPLPHRWRLALGATAGRAAFGALKSMRRRADDNLSLVFPEMPASERTRLAKSMAANVGRTLLEILQADQFLARGAQLSVSGPGLEAIQQAQAEGKGALVISGHFGQWEAIRTILLRHEITCGAVYRPYNNRLYDRLLLNQIEKYGTPIAPKGRSGTRQLVKALSSGGVMAILLDQKAWDGDPVEFLGHPALTSNSAAELGLRYDLPIVPAYGIRNADDPTRIEVVFEAPIAHSTVAEMTRALNKSLEEQVLKRPDLWLWLHKRWDKRPEDLSGS